MNRKKKSKDDAMEYAMGYLDKLVAINNGEK